MNDTSLLVRMSVVSAVLFAFYLGLVQLGLAIGLGLPVIVVGLVAFVAVQYLIGTYGVLRQVGAVDLPRDDFEAFHRDFEKAATEMGFDEPPRLMMAEMGVPNAFAVGRKGSGTVVVSAELIEVLDFDEAAAVTAHELAHLKNRDSLVMVVGESVSTIFALIVFLVVSATDSLVLDIIGYVLSVVTKLFVMLFVMALSRYREFAADRDAAELMETGDPLARALAKIDRFNDGAGATAQTNVSALCICPLGDSLLSRLFSTHPSTEARIERLESV